MDALTPRTLSQDTTRKNTRRYTALFLSMAIQLIGVDNLADASQGLNEVSNNALTQSLQANAASVSNAQKILADGNTAIAQQAVSIAQSSTQKAQASANSVNGVNGLLNAVSTGVQTYWKNKQQEELTQAEINAKRESIQQRDEQASATAKAATDKANADSQSADAYNVARVQLGDLYNGWRSADKFRTDPGGMTAYRDQSLKIIADNPQLQADEKKELISLVYDNWNSEMKSFGDRTAKYADEVSQAQRETVVKERTFRVNAVVSQFTWDTDPADGLKKVDGLVSETLSDTKLPLLDRIQAANSMLETAYSKVTSNSVARAEIERKLGSLQQYQKEDVVNWSDPSKTFAERKAYSEQLQLKYGLAGVDNSYMSYENARRTAIEYEQQSRQIGEFQKSGLIDAARAVNLNDEQVGSVVQLILYGQGNTAAIRERFENSQYFEANTAGAGEIRRLLNEVPKMRKEVIDIQQEKATLRQAQASLQKEGLTYLINADARTRGLLDAYAKQFMVNLPASEAGLTDAQKREYAANIDNINRAIQNRIIINDGRLNDISGQLAKYRLNEPEDILRKNASSRKQLVESTLSTLSTQAEQIRRSQQQQNGQLGINSPINANGEGQNRERLTFVAADGYRRLRPPSTVNLATVSFNGADANGKTPRGSKILLPFSAADAGKVSINDGNFLEQRSTHKHAGEDIATPNGTRVISYVSGEVVQVERQSGIGYGRFVTIKGDDGYYHRFAHLSAQSVVSGQRINAGDQLGLTGADGSPGSYHLHWEVRTNEGYGTVGTINPIKYMSGVNFKESKQAQPRGNTNGWEYNTTTPPNSRVPANSMRLPNGKYIINNNQSRLGDDSSTPTTSIYSVGNPVRTGSVKPNEYSGKNNSGDTYGYSYIANNPQFGAKLADISNKLGVNGQWLADIFAFETGNFEKVNNWSHPSSGAVGLIGFTSDNAEEWGTTTYALQRMSPVQQLDYVYKYLNRPNIKPYISQGVDYLAASIFGGSGLLTKLRTNRTRALNIGDGAINLRGYLKKLGRDVGRKYNIQSSTRTDRLLASAIHTGYIDGCLHCEALRQSGSDIVPHTSEFDA